MTFFCDVRKLIMTSNMCCHRCVCFECDKHPKPADERRALLAAVKLDKRRKRRVDCGERRSFDPNRCQRLLAYRGLHGEGEAVCRSCTLLNPCSKRGVEGYLWISRALKNKKRYPKLRGLSRVGNKFVVRSMGNIVYRGYSLEQAIAELYAAKRRL